MGAWLAVIGSFLAIVAGVFVFFARRNSDRRKRLEEAKNMLNKGIEDGDTSAITAGFNRKRNAP